MASDKLIDVLWGKPSAPCQCLSKLLGCDLHLAIPHALAPAGPAAQWLLAVAIRADPCCRKQLATTLDAGHAPCMAGTSPTRSRDAGQQHQCKHYKDQKKKPLDHRGLGGFNDGTSPLATVIEELASISETGRSAFLSLPYLDVACHLDRPIEMLHLVRETAERLSRDDHFLQCRN